MKITKQRLKEIIKEEVVKILEGKKTNASGTKDKQGGWQSGVIAEPVFEEEELDETSAMGGTPTGAVAGYSGPVKKEEKLSPKQSKEMDTDKDGDIDAKDLKPLRLKEDGGDEPIS